ncbi:hypothetical protein [Yersinia frederiksenii]|uniref:hypothetical protein n=1 Tax=Yersinia frederiksenii TaxID=29484 RepID=UPI000BFE5542|nr:hypothetical protein [Yersinia frederiksenii]ATM85047.1 hypothetical protein CRN74_02510 [Yersinia frederiksenii]HDL7750581.1 hypothetical protein [Yersinia enterocolitica]
MSNIELINKRRKHIVDAKLESMMRKTNSHCVIVSLKDGGMYTVELSERVLIEALIDFEAEVYGEYKRLEAAEHIINTYDSFLSKSGDHLTEAGKDFMNAIVKNIAETTKAKGKAK